MRGKESSSPDLRAPACILLSWFILLQYADGKSGKWKKEYRSDCGNAPKTPQRHSRAGGNPFIKLEQALIWVPACAGRRRTPDLNRVADFFTRSKAGIQFLTLEQDLRWVSAFAETTLRRSCRRRSFSAEASGSFAPALG